MAISPEDLKYFIVVSEAGNITRASERLGLTQSSLSYAIKRLEQEIGTSLLIRSKTGVRLTKAGERTARMAQSALEQFDKIKQAALDEQNQIIGSFKIGIHSSVAIYSLHRFLPQLMKDNPKLEFSFKHGLSREVTEDVISWRCDFAIAVNPVEHPDLVITKLCSDVVTLWQSQSKNSNNDVIVYNPQLTQSQFIIKKFKERGEVRHVTCENLEVISSLVKADIGLGVIPQRVAETFDLKKIKGAPEFKDEICLIYRADMDKTSSRRVIIDAIKNAKW